jgi:hypothetical protein
MDRDAENWEPMLRLPKGYALDPISECELALELGMSLAELHHGRGTPMPLFELTVIWPLFWGYRNRMRERQRAAEERAQRKIVR